MAQIIDIKKRLDKAPNNLITSKPLEFRRSPWETPYFSQMLKPLSTKLEAQRRDSRGAGEPWQLPPHFTLVGGIGWTIRTLFACRKSEQKAREVYHLVGLMDCMVNQVNPVLRTDLIRDLYKKVFSMKRELGVNWYGSIDQVLLPIDSHLFSEAQYRFLLRDARTMKDLYRIIREAMGEMFAILSNEYVFYCPSVGG